MPVLMWGWLEIAQTVRTDDIASDLSKPFSYFGYWLSRDLGRAAYHVLYRSVPTVLLGALLFDVRAPQRLHTWLLFAVSVLLAVGLGFCVRFIINVSGFWATDVRGMNNLALVAVNFLTGFIVPLEFFPPGVRGILEILPFAGMISIPINVWLEHAVGWEAVGLLLRQTLWTVLFVLTCQLMLQAATRKLVVQGG